MAGEQTPNFRGYISELNALRAVGVVAVILFHLWPSSSTPWGPLRLSWILMDSFFVLSGFLITGILLDSRERPDYYKSFYVRRVLRIFPLYYVVITLVTLALLFQHGDNIAMRTWGSPGWFFVYLGNFPTAIRNTWPAKPFGPLWSLQVEEQFYLLFPLLVHRLKKGTLARVLWGLVAFSLIARLCVYWLLPGNQSVQYVLLPLRMDGLALGAWVALRFRQGPWALRKGRVTIGMAGWTTFAIVIGLLGGSWDNAIIRTIGFFISSVACTYILLWLILYRGSRLTAVLRSQPIQYLSKISYALYLLHMLVRETVATILTRTIGASYLNDGFANLALVFLLSLIAASISWRFLESPLLRLDPRIAVERLTLPDGGGRRIAVLIDWRRREPTRVATPTAPERGQSPLVEVSGAGKSTPRETDRPERRVLDFA